MEENFKKVNKKEIAKLLGKSYSTIKKWDEDKLAKELLGNCYKIISVNHRGNSILYTLEYVEQETSIYIILQGELNIKKGKEFKKYVDLRLHLYKNGDGMSVNKLSKEVGVGTSTIKDWDRMLVEKGVLIKEKDRLVYAVAPKVVTEPINPIITKEMYKELRSDWYQYVRSLHLEHECKICGKKEGLEVHHLIPFSNLLNEAINVLNMDGDNFNFEVLRCFFIGIQQIKGKYVTLCKDCHIEEHGRCYRVSSYKPNLNNPLTLKIIKELEL